MRERYMLITVQIAKKYGVKEQINTAVTLYFSARNGCWSNMAVVAQRR